MERQLLTVDEAARVLGLGKSKTYALVADGDLPVVRIGKAIRIPLFDLHAWIRDQVEAQNPGYTERHQGADRRAG